MLTTSKNANPNYLAKVVRLQGVRKHRNADRLQVVDIDFQTVVTGLDAKDGDVYVYFPVECTINKDFLSVTNSFRDKSLNNDPEKAGFFEDKGRVKAIKLRGEKSMGYVVPINTVVNWALGEKLTNDVHFPEEDLNKEFDTINGLLLLEKFEVKKKGDGVSKQGKKPKLSRLIDGQVRLHVDTENLRKNAFKIDPEDIISITYKTHGTSWWVANVNNKRQLSRFEKFLKWTGVEITDTEYAIIYGSRRVVKNAELEDSKQKDHYFGYDLWEGIKNEVQKHIPKGFTLYGEMVGYDANGSPIQQGYDYGCSPDGESLPQHKLEIYRITSTNVDGLVIELTYNQIKEFCDKTGLTVSHLYYYGKAKNWSPVIKTDTHWHENFVKALESDFNEKNCFMCNNKVPEEGIVVRRESLFNCESFKLKSFKFLSFESEMLDKGVSDLESEN